MGGGETGPTWDRWAGRSGRAGHGIGVGSGGRRQGKARQRDHGREGTWDGRGWEERDGMACAGQGIWGAAWAARAGSQPNGDGMAARHAWPQGFVCAGMAWAWALTGGDCKHRAAWHPSPCRPWMLDGLGAAS